MSSSAWRFVKLAFKMRAPEPAFRHVLLTLADFANQKGECYPSYQTLMEETGYASKQTIADALRYWRDKGVITWEKGWGNSHKSKPNVYRFNEQAMWRQVSTAMKVQPMDKVENLESPVSADESPVSLSRKSTEGVMKVHSMDSKVPALERPSSIERPSHGTGGVSTPLQKSLDQQTESPKGSQNGESTVSGLSSFPGLDYDEREPVGRRWFAKRGLGRAATPEEMAEMQRRNREHMRPETIQ